MTVTSTQIPERTGVTLEIFRNEIVPAFRPVVLRGLVKDWAAISESAASPRAALDYLVRHAANVPVVTFMGAPEIGGRFFYRDDMRGVNFEQKQESFHESLQRLSRLLDAPDGASVYIGSQAVADLLPALNAMLRTPLVHASIEPRVWIGNRTIVSAHYDLSDNIACVVAGKRRFTVLPPEQTRNLYVSPLEFTLAGQPASLVEFNNPDYDRHPLFAEAVKHAEVAELGPGDAIYIPYLWWHHVEGLDPFNVLVNYWWTDADSGSPEAFEAMMHGVMAVKPLPPKRREAWRAIYDHYVFEKNGDAAAHLPPYAKGVLGPPGPKLRDYIRTWLMRALSRRGG